MRFKVVRTFFDDGAFGYVAPPTEEVIRDWLTKAEAKAIYRHYEKKHWYDEDCTIEVFVMYDGEWICCSQEWIYTAEAEQELWFDRMGLDYYWWLYSGKIKKL